MKCRKASETFRHTRKALSPEEAGQSGEGRQAIERSSFLKKRSKKLLRPRSGRRRAPNKQKFFGSRRAGAAFFSKKNCFLPSPDCPA
jgi:hypothetical protein